MTQISPSVMFEGEDAVKEVCKHEEKKSSQGIEYVYVM